MNLLVDDLPESLTVDNMEYRIRTDFRIYILFELLWQDDSLKPKEKLKKSFTLCYRDEIPRNYEEAANALMWFYKCGKEDNPQKKAIAAKRGKTRIYSFDYDDDYIFAAFMSQYKINLQRIKHLHWWEFRAMFNSLTNSNEFVKIMEYRSIDLKEDMPKEQKAFYRKMKLIHDLPLPKDEEEKQQAIEDALMNGGDLTGIL